MMPRPIHSRVSQATASARRYSLVCRYATTALLVVSFTLASIPDVLAHAVRTAAPELS